MMEIFCKNFETETELIKYIHKIFENIFGNLSKLYRNFREFLKVK